MKKLLILFVLVLLAACAATQATDAVAPTAPGFRLGLWHGFIFPVAWLISLFAPKVAVYAVLFNTLVIVVKLVLGPHGFYEVNQIRNLTSGFEIDDSLAAVFAAAGIFLLYAGVYTVLYRFFRSRIDHLAAEDR